MTLLEACTHFYHDNKLFEWQTDHSTIPRQCVQFSGVYNLMHYHLDVNFMPPHVNQFFCLYLSKYLIFFLLFYLYNLRLQLMF